MINFKNFNIFCLLLTGLLIFMTISCVGAADVVNSTTDIEVSHDSNSLNLHNGVCADFNGNSLSQNSSVGKISSNDVGQSNPESFSDLEMLIKNAPKGSIIELPHDYAWSDSIKNISIDKALTIDGQGHTIDAKGKSGIFSIVCDNVVLKNIIFINGYSGEGGAIHLAALKCTISNCTFINNTAFSSGGAIFAENNIGNISNSLTVDNCHFIGNSACLMGGSICSIWGSSKISNSVFINDHSSYGGSILSLYNNLNVFDSYFYNDTASEFGGAIYKKSGSYKSSNGWIKYTSNSSLVNSIFEDNHAYYDGGAVYVSHDNLTVNDALFSGNVAAYGGGALHLLVSYCFPNNVTFQGSFKESNLNGVVNTQYINSFIDSGNNVSRLVTNNSNYNGSIPSYFNLKDMGQMSSVKNQYGKTCWAYAGISALESAILKASGYTDDLSENNLINILDGYSDYGIENKVPKTGGYNIYLAKYLASWLGPVGEFNDPAKGNYFSPILKSNLHVQNIVFLPKLNNNTAVIYKEAIMKYGAISTSMLMDTPSGYNYYTNISDDDHMINIVGWDDNYKASNFPGTGAWICKNSWGADWGNEGYFYVSYYDNSLGRAYSASGTTSIAIFFNDTISYNRNYQYDYGNLKWVSKKVKNVWYKNTYTGVADEKICAFSSYFHENADWEVSIYVNNELKHSQKGNSISAGYFTFNLNKTISIHKGDQVCVVLKTSNGNSCQYIPVCNKSAMVSKPCGEGVSYWSNDGNVWNDFNDSGYVACLKLFTQNNGDSNILVVNEQ